MIQTGPETPARMVQSWRPAAARSVVTARLDDDILRLEGRDGRELWQLRLDAVQQVRLSHHAVRGQGMTRLELTTDGDTVRRLEVNSPMRWPSEHRDAFMAMTSAVLGRLAEINPDLPYFLGASRATSIAMLAIGVVTALAGAGLGLAMMLEGEIGPALGVGGIICLTGLGIAAGAYGSSREQKSRPLARALDEDAGLT